MSDTTIARDIEGALLVHQTKFVLSAETDIVVQWAPGSRIGYLHLGGSPLEGVVLGVADVETALKLEAAVSELVDKLKVGSRAHLQTVPSAGSPS